MSDGLNNRMGGKYNEFSVCNYGCGKYCGEILRCSESVKECEVAAVSSKSMERAADFSRRNNVPKAYDDYEEMFQKERPDCVYIATTPDSHSGKAGRS